MIGALTGAAKTTAEAERLQVRARRSVAMLAAARTFLTAIAAAGLLDLLLPWPVFLRGLFVLALLGVTARQGFRFRRWMEQEHLGEAQVARAVEARRPDLDNALIHAVQFGKELERDPAAPAAILMRREISRAQRLITQLGPVDVVDPTPLLRERKTLLGIVGFLLLTALLFPRAYRFEIPRFAAFWRDDAPFTLTDFALSPAEAHVRAGNDLTVTVRVGGLMPHDMQLVTEAAGEGRQAVPLTAAGNGVYTGTLESLRRDTAYMAVADTGRSGRGHVLVDSTPHVRKLIVTLHPPSSAHQPDSTVELGEEKTITGRAGTRVTLDVEADQPLASGELVVARDGMTALSQPLAPKAKDSAEAAATFPLERDGDFRVSLTGASASGGVRSPDVARGKIVLQRDETPLVTFLSPAQNVIAAPGMTVPLKVEAEDDIALQRLELHRVLNRGQDTAQVVHVPDNARDFTHADRIDLKALGAKPGDVIEYYATAYDNDPAGVHNADSDRYQVQVVSDADYKRILERQRGPSQMIAQYRALVEGLRGLAEAQRRLAEEMTVAAKEAQSLRPGDRAAEVALRAKMETLRQRQRELQTQAEDLARQMRELARRPAQFDIETGLQRRLTRLARALRETQTGAMQAAQSASSPADAAKSARTAAAQMQKALNGSGAAIDRATQTLERTLALYQDMNRLQQLAQEQAQLAQQAQQVRDSAPNGRLDTFALSRLKSLAARQQRNRDALAQLEQDLPIHAQEARADAPEAARAAAQIAQALRRQETGQTMQGAQQALERQDTAGGAAQTETARRALESLLGDSRQCQQQANGACRSQTQSLLGAGAGNSLSQMAQRMSQGFGASGPGGGQGSSGDSTSSPGSQADRGTGGSGGNATALSLVAQAAGSRPGKRGGPRGERANALSAAAGERPDTDQPRTLPTAKDQDASRYPTEYRRLVQDYFQAVAGGK